MINSKDITDDKLLFLFLFFCLVFLIIFYVQSKKAKSFVRVIARIMPLSNFRIRLFRFGGVKIGKNCILSKNIKIIGDVVIGDQVKIGKSVEIYDGTLVGKTTIIEDSVSLYMVKIGSGTLIHKNSILYGSKTESISIGSNCVIGYSSILDGSGGLSIDDNVHLASPSTGIWTHSSVDNCLSGEKLGTLSYEKKIVYASVSIGANTWIGGNCTIMPGTNLGQKTLVMPNSVVNRNLKDKKMYGGVPVEEIEYKRYNSWR